MKKLVLAIALSCSFLASNFCSANPIEIVKKTVFPQLSIAKTIGAALDTYSSCKPGTQKWVTAQHDKGQMVVFSCVDQTISNKMLDWEKSFIKKEMEGPTKFFGSNTDSIESVADALSWIETHLNKKDQYKLLSEYGYGIDFFKRVIFSGLAFKVKHVDFTVHLLQNQNNKNNFDVVYVGHNLKYSGDFIGKASWTHEVLKSTIYLNQDFLKTFEDQLKGRSNFFVDIYKEAQSK